MQSSTTSASPIIRSLVIAAPRRLLRPLDELLALPRLNRKLLPFPPPSPPSFVLFDPAPFPSFAVLTVLFSSPTERNVSAKRKGL